MNDTARLYSCSRCQALVFICRSCDRGNVYCKECALIAGLEAKRRASTKYQISFPGRQKHAERQRRYRERLKNKVTHKGSLATKVRALLRQKEQRAKILTQLPVTTNHTSITCHRCCSICSPFLRHDFLKRSA